MVEQWKKSWGWRAGEQYVEPGASVADVIRHETEELGNELNLLVDLSELETVSARRAVWLCRTRREAVRYGTPYRVDTIGVCIVATDLEEPQGYLVVLSE